MAEHDETPEERERRLAADLLAGFDRPGRGPRRAEPRVRDFLAHYAGGGAAPGPGEVPPSAAAPVVGRVAEPAEPAEPTPATSRVPPRVAWVGTGVALTALAVAVAWIATADPPRPDADPTGNASAMPGAANAKAPPSASATPSTSPSASATPGATPSATPSAGPVASARAVTERRVPPPASARPAGSAAPKDPRDDLLRELH